MRAKKLKGYHGLRPKISGKNKLKERTSTGGTFFSQISGKHERPRQGDVGQAQEEQSWEI